MYRERLLAQNLREHPVESAANDASRLCTTTLNTAAALDSKPALIGLAGVGVRRAGVVVHHLFIL